MQRKIDGEKDNKPLGIVSSVFTIRCYGSHKCDLQPTSAHSIDAAMCCAPNWFTYKMLFFHLMWTISCPPACLIIIWRSWSVCTATIRCAVVISFNVIRKGEIGFTHTTPHSTGRQMKPHFGNEFHWALTVVNTRISITAIIPITIHENSIACRI